jgi:hypothetical protein
MRIITIYYIENLKWLVRYFPLLLELCWAQQLCSKLSTSWEQAVRTYPVDKLLEQHCYKSAAGLLQRVCFYVCENARGFLNYIDPVTTSHRIQNFNLSQQSQINVSRYRCFLGLKANSLLIVWLLHLLGPRGQRYAEHHRWLEIQWVCWEFLSLFALYQIKLEVKLLK